MSIVNLCDIISYNQPHILCEFRWYVFSISQDFYYVRVKFPDGKTHYCYYQTYSQLLYFFNIIKRTFK